MGSFFFQGNGPFERAIQREPTVTAEGEDVVVTFPELIAGPPSPFFRSEYHSRYSRLNL